MDSVSDVFGGGIERTLVGAMDSMRADLDELLAEFRAKTRVTDAMGEKIAHAEDLISAVRVTVDKLLAGALDDAYGRLDEIVVAYRSGPRYKADRSVKLVVKPGAEPVARPVSQQPVPGPKRKFMNYIQKYDAKTFELLGWYEGPNHAVTVMGEGSAQKVTDAARAKRLYYEYRWEEVPKGEDQTKRRDIGPTSASQTCLAGLVAKLSDDLKTVEEVYESQQAAATANNCTPPAISKRVMTSTGNTSRRWLMWRDVTSEMQQEYLQRHALPAKPRRNGRGVLRLDPVTRAVLETYDTAARAKSAYGMGADSLKAACDGASVHTLKGFLWKWAGDDNALADGGVSTSTD